MTRTLTQRVSAAAHADLPYANPLSDVQMASLVAWVVARAPATLLDIGCGAGVFSISVASTFPAKILAIDLDVSRARAAAAVKTLAGYVEFWEGPMREVAVSRYDAVVCVGSSHALGSPREALKQCRELLNSDGVLVYADLVWTSPPTSEYLSFLGCEEGHYWHRAEGPDVFRQAGLKIDQEIVASTESWLAYEEAVLLGRRRFSESLPDGEKQVVLSNAETWSAMYALHGRACLGFVSYVARLA